jgi:hypothetical protein
MATTKKRAAAKYADKSAGQPELKPIFDKLRKLVSSYEKGNFRSKADKPGHYELYYDKEVEVAGRKYPELSFASVLIQKGYVGFYFFPIYVDEGFKKKVGAGLLKTLKGKTCFHIKNDDKTLFDQVKQALSDGYEEYKKNGWS